MKKVIFIAVLTLFSTNALCKEKTPPPDIVIQLHIKNNNSNFKEMTSRDLSVKDITYLSRDINGDGYKDWTLWDTTMCGSGGCSGNIYIYDNGTYCYAMEDSDFNKITESTEIIKNLKCDNSSVSIAPEKTNGQENQEIERKSNAIKIKGFYIGMDFHKACSQIAKVLNKNISEIGIDETSKSCSDNGRAAIRVFGDNNGLTRKIELDKYVFNSNSNSIGFIEELSKAYNLQFRFESRNATYGYNIDKYIHTGDDEFITVNSLGSVDLIKRNKGSFD